MHANVCECAYMHAGAHCGQNSLLDTLELECKVVVSYPVWVLGSKLSFERAECSLNHWAISPVTTYVFISKAED